MEITDHSDSIVAGGPEPKAKPVKKMWGPVSAVVLTIFIYLATQIVTEVIILLYTNSKGWSTSTAQAWLTSSVLAQFFMIFLIEALVVLAVYGVLKLRRLSMKAIGLVKPHAKEALYALIGFGIYFLAYIAIFFVVQKLVPQINLDQKQEIGFETAKSTKDMIFVFLSLVILPPIAEEILVRGFLYTGLRTKLKFIPAAIITSILFAMAHLQFGSGAPLLWAAAIDTFTLSMVLVYLRETRNSLTASIILHMLKNGMAFMLLFVFKAGM